MANEIVYGAQLAVLDFAGLSMTGTDYSARFLVDFDVASQFPLESILADAPSNFPDWIRGDPQDRVVPVHITIDAQLPSQNLIDVLKTAFSPSGDIDFLRVRDENGNIRRMRAKSLGLVPWEGHDDVSYVASLHAPEPVWESDEPDVAFYNVSGNAGTTSKSWEIVNSGNEECFPVITITPYANRSGAGAGQHQLPIVIAWRSSLEGVDSQGLPYPIDVTDGAWDTSGLADFNVTGSAAYVRAWLDGVEISRYIEDPLTANTSVWCSIPFQPTRQAELFANITGSSSSLSVTSADDLAAFPDTGFVLIGTECVAYQGKTATSLLALKRGQRGTAAASHTAGATVYWVEHDIRLTWGDAIPFVAGQELADEKPIIDLAMSTNLHHMYGLPEGMIAPETLRTGQWVRELRAPAGGRRAQYSSLLQDPSGPVIFTDQLPEAGAPNFDSLSLYTPCFVSANVTGVELAVEVDHHMLLNVYGVDEGGFESVLWRQSIRGPVGATFAPDAYHVGPPSTEVIVVDPPAPLARVTLQGRTAILTGVDIRVVDPVVLQYAEVGPDGLNSTQAAQTFSITTLATIDEVVFTGMQQVSAMDGVLYVVLRIPGFVGVALTGNPANAPQAITSADLPPNGADPDEQAVTVGELAEIARPRLTGPIAAHFTNLGGATTGAIYIYANYTQSPSGSEWIFQSPNWAEAANKDLLACLVSYNAEPQEDASFGTGRTVYAHSVDVHFDSAYTPLIVLGDDAPCYILNEEVLTNVDTGESLVLTGVLPIADVSYDVVKVDSSSHILTKLTDAVGDYEQAAGYFAEPSNIITWLRLLPGVNNITFSDLEGGTRLGVRFYLRSRWT